MNIVTLLKSFFNSLCCLVDYTRDLASSKKYQTAGFAKTYQTTCLVDYTNVKIETCLYWFFITIGQLHPKLIS